MSLKAFDIPLAHLPLRPSSLQIFQKRGFTSSKELDDAKKCGMSSLAIELGLPIHATAELLREVQACIERENLPVVGNKQSSSNSSTAPAARSIGISAYELLNDYQNHHQHGGGGGTCIISFCRAVDQMLGGGIGLGELTEIAGLPGAGKTQWGMQLAVDARLPIEFGGVAGETIYIDSEGSFAPDRCFSMATSLVNHVQQGLKRRKEPQQQQQQSIPDWFTPEGILSGIHVFRVHDEAAQTAVIQALSHFIQQRQQSAGGAAPIKLIVIDSMAFHYRASGPETDFVQRTQSLMRLASLLAGIAMQYKLAVVAVNQMTTKFSANGTADGTHNVPALGESWAHAVTTRLLLQGSGASVRKCQLVKSPRFPSATADFQIVEAGIRGVEYVERDANSKRLKTVME